MDFRHFQTFVIAAEELHFGRTADRLGIAQPAVTQQMKTLETQLGFKVFHRVRRGIELTAAGAVFLEHAKATLAQAHTAIMAGRRASRGELGKLCIAYANSAVLEPELLALLRRFAQEKPDVELELRSVSVQEQMRALADDRIDLAFLRSPPGPLPNFIKITPFSRTPLDLVMSADHRCAARKRLSLRDVAQDRFIVVDDPPGLGLGHRVVELCLEAGFEPNVFLRTTDSLGVVSFAAAGLGVGLVPRSLSRYPVEGAVCKPLSIANGFSEVVIASRAYDRSAATRAFLGLLPSVG
ncbi:LysR family transcriptional regulator [Paraburkholderia sp. MMS20-SJTR3]|uniref:LysR family transcriptional regulator n=1 Tax=Paraburkholderia sejongensis TaxID=2886946 RepID=A0ABS8JRG0_9BURK|nr:LysR family transcriptional regulator [Paraburkholderia sp. MMS20-SJTR3]